MTWSSRNGDARERASSSTTTVVDARRSRARSRTSPSASTTSARIRRAHGPRRPRRWPRGATARRSRPGQSHARALSGGGRHRAAHRRGMPMPLDDRTRMKLAPPAQCRRLIGRAAGRRLCAVIRRRADDTARRSIQVGTLADVGEVVIRERSGQAATPGEPTDLSVLRVWLASGWGWQRARCRGVLLAVHRASADGGATARC